jgi:catechol 2,3-dioxygenase-like lactoylglutathione lyase family enzyme
MNRPSMLGIRHVALKVRSMPAMRAFYVDILGYRVEWEPDPENLYLSSGSDNLALHVAKEQIGSGSLDHLGLIVRNPDDVDNWASFLKSREIHLKQEPKTHRDGARSIYLTDPESNLIQIIYHPPISGKH